MIIKPVVGAIVNFEGDAFVAPIVNNPGNASNIEPAPAVSATPAVTASPTPTVSNTPSPTVTPTPTPSTLPVTLNVSGLPTTGKVGIQYLGQIVGEPNQIANYFTIWLNDLPPGLELNEDSGTVYGTPTKAGTYEVGFAVTNGVSSDQEIVTIIIS